MNYHFPTAYKIGDMPPLVITTREPRQPAYCECGARLSVYRTGGETRCAPCQLHHAPSLDELHPVPHIDRLHRGEYRACPECGGRMHRRAKRCLPCHRRAQAAP